MIKILATNPYSVVFEKETINSLFDNGLDILYVIKPKFNRTQMNDFILGIEPQHRSKLIISSFYSLANEYNLKGFFIDQVKLNSFIFKVFKLPYIFKKYPNIDFYTQVKHVHQIEKVNPKIKNILVYPVFIENYSDNIVKLVNSNSLDYYKETRQIFAMGGVNESRIPEVVKLGFNGFVLQSAIWRSSNHVKSFEKIIQVLYKSKSKSNLS